LTDELDLDMVKVSHYAKYLGQRSFQSKVIARTDRQTDRHTHTHTHTAERLHYTAAKAVCHTLKIRQELSSC